MFEHDVPGCRMSLKDSRESIEKLEQPLELEDGNEEEKDELETFMDKILVAIIVLLLFAGCTHKVEVSAKEPITINLNLKIDHEIRVKVDKELDDIFSEDSEIF